MRTEREPKVSQRMHRALTELQDLVREHYPDASFRVVRSADDARAIHLLTTVDVPDTTEVVDVVLERVLAFQIDQGLPIHVIPLRPRARVLEMLRADHAAGASAPELSHRP